MDHPPRRTILITGATGYVGGRLVKRLESSGHTLRCLARTPANLVERVGPAVQVIEGDVTQPESLDRALQGVDTAFYLVHALGAGGDFETTELEGARNFGEAARKSGVRRIIYLGGLSADDPSESAHMRSRHAVGAALRDSGVPTIEFRASIIIGAGSLSFELVRSLVQRLPVMIVPRWVRVKAQPIAIDDVLEYLVQAIDVPLPDSTSYEIGGQEQLSYLDLMKRYGELVGLRRFYINVPFLTPRLSGLWLNLVTPLFATVGRRLISSIRVASVVRDDRARRDFSVTPMDVTESIRRALEEEDRAFVLTHWSDSLSHVPQRAYAGQRFGSRIVDSRMVTVHADAGQTFACIERIGGKNGWYYADWLWTVRGSFDRAIGGVGMQRGRRHPEHLRTGDVVDCWRVEVIERPRKLLLRAEMKVFGRAWLQFDVGSDDGRTKIIQSAIYDPRGVSGLMYWYALYPIHEFVFRGMLIGIARVADGPASDNDARAIKVAPDHGSLPPLN